MSTDQILHVDHKYEADIQEDLEELGDDLAECLAEHVCGDWADNGIGPYEYWGARGVHVDWCYEVEHTRVVVDVTDCAVIPKTGKAKTTIGGCDGEHRGPCKLCCQEVEVTYKITLHRVLWQDGKLLAEYGIN